ncbi:zeaxanthin glucosyl transferase [Synechocystis sp. PCC 6803]|uniref:Zeaxanthin glucosyl transferase n=1 Tax=Synechocystis sp. (strain ATCC 27184 / PCC 6803 / Kazusa) TaxID=1111708 RepID=P72650_SYNY3|nr:MULTISPECIES: glycosyltransferase [unclassified Synechocystis]AGF50341.1 zeaxanthin glucosyl transferase [Synechocystis sp. PCC 6803]ALJ66436.1 glycosyl transferase family 1 [Synechocystis sp. PCC 6803]AVP91165.1 glycosyl transferase family 1 [Synechocystis sp. IPPAS B-1465]MBD2619295.1 glycosyltransferase [Synechocystis sp. FACHB-898]MBD2637665.1 glycosyltransferase [Synechocystis sp. FACHB-908]
MTHFGLLCPATTGHLNTMLPLGKELQQRGHTVTMFGVLDAQAKTLAAGLNFQAIATTEFPLGAQAEFMAELGKLSGIKALQYTVAKITQKAAAFFEEAPGVMAKAGVEVLLVDQVSQEGGTIGDRLGIPFISICSAVVLNREPTIPPYATPWPYDPSWLGQLRNRLGYGLLNRATKPITALINDYRQRWNLPAQSSPNDRYSPLAQISQQPAAFEFPRECLPSRFHFTGPFHSNVGRDIADFPWEQLTDQPIIYASLGTIQNQLMSTFKIIAEACMDLDAQLIISLGGAKLESMPALPGNPLVVNYAPQLELLQRTALTITHAGLNTTLECLNNAVPMVAIPIANDQPGVAARIAWAGVGEFIPLSKLNTNNLRAALEKVLTEDSYKRNTLQLQQAIKTAGGLTKAADIIEQVTAEAMG